MVSSAVFLKLMTAALPPIVIRWGVSLTKDYDGDRSICDISNLPGSVQGV